MTRPASLAEENDYLRAQVHQLKDALGSGLRWPAEWNLSPRETAMLGVLVSRDLATRDAIMCALYGDDPEPPVSGSSGSISTGCAGSFDPAASPSSRTKGRGSPCRRSSAPGCARPR